MKVWSGITREKPAYPAGYAKVRPGARSPETGPCRVPIKPGSCSAVSNGRDWFVASDKPGVMLERQNGDFYARQWMRGLVTGVSPQAVGFGALFGVVGYLAAATLLDDGKTGASQKVPNKARFDPGSATFRPYRRIMNY